MRHGSFLSCPHSLKGLYMRKSYYLKGFKCKNKSFFFFFFFLIILPFYSYSQTFSVSPSMAIPGAATVFAQVAVSSLSPVMDVSFGIEKICIDITHPQTDDLTLWLISPNGTEILLSAENGGSGDNYTMTCFDGNQANPNITSGSAPFTGNFLPEQSLGFLNVGTIDPNGTWKLKIKDDFFFRSGTLNSFSITFGNNPALVPTSSNDDCVNAIPLNINSNFTCTLLNAATLSNATQSPESDLCNFTNSPFDDDIWFVFTATSNSHEFLISSIVGSSNELIFQVSSGVCGNIVPIFCYENNNHNFTVHDLTIGNAYFLRIASKSNVNPQNISFNICIKFGIPNPPPNDECAGAYSIPAGGSGCTGVLGTVNGATASADLFSCGTSGGFTNDVWFSFTAAQSSHQIFVSDISGTATDLDFQLNQGNCGNLSQKLCFYDPIPGDEIIIPVNNLTIGNTYYLRVSTFNNAPQNTSFKICLGTPPPSPVNDNCAGAIELTQLANDCNIITSTIEGASGQKGFECDVSFEDYFDDDVWFKFTPSSSSHEIDIFNISGSTNDLVYEVLSGTCANLNPLLCQDDPNNEILLTGLNQNKVYFIRVASYLDLIENTNFEIRIRHDNLIVCNENESGPGTLREAIINANAGETIQLDETLNNKPLYLDFPPLIIDKPLSLNNNFGENIIFKNADPNFFEVLMKIQNQFSVKSLILQGTSEDALKIEIKNGGSLISY